MERFSKLSTAEKIKDGPGLIDAAKQARGARARRRRRRLARAPARAPGFAP